MKKLIILAFMVAANTSHAMTELTTCFARLSGPINTIAVSAENLNASGISIVGTGLISASGDDRTRLEATLNRAGDIMANGSPIRSVILMGCKSEILE
jgi:hypothetical protein